MPKKHFEFIDAIRGIAALHVLLIHLAFIPNPSLLIPQWLSMIGFTGNSGVELFFVLSAFCLCLSMRAHGQEDTSVWQFYIRRIFRILPFFYLMLLIFLLRNKIVYGISYSWTDLLSNLFCIFNFIPEKTEGIAWASWTISVEMIFYLFFPFIFRTIGNIWKSLIFLCFTLIVDQYFTAYVYSSSLDHKQMNVLLKLGFFCHLPSFALGILAFFIFERFVKSGITNKHLYSYFLILISISGYVLLSNSRWRAASPYSFLYPWYSLLYAILIIGLALVPVKLFVNRITLFYGKVSYSMYLSHPLIVFSLIPVYQLIYSLYLPITIQFGLCLFITLLPLTFISFLGYHLIEQPGISFGNRLIQKFRKLDSAR